MTVPPGGRGPEVSGVAAFFLAFSTLTIILRSYCRVVIVKSFGLDDWFAVIAWVLFAFFCGFATAGVYHGTGQHATVVPPEEIPVGLKWWWACEPVYVLSNMALKFSIGIMLLRITVKQTHKIIIWTTIAIVEIYGAFFFFLFVLQCRPSSYFWTQYTGGKGTCIDPRITVAATYAYSAISCAGDWTLGILPIFLVWNLQMNPRTKLVVAMILALGAIASTATIIRIPYVSSLANQADFLYATTDVAIWSCAETGIGIAASSFATLRPLFRNFFSRSKLWGASSSRQTPNRWPSAAGPTGGYIRSRSKGGIEEFGLRSDIGKTRGVTTVIESGEGATDLEKGVGSKGSRGHLRRASEWSNSESKLTLERSSGEGEEPSWSGIMKTTVSTQVKH